MTSPTVDRRLGLVGNIAMKAPVTALAAGNITQSGEQTVDGVAVLATNAAGVPDRVLCVGMTDATKNGIWNVSTGSWTRAADADGNYDFAAGSTVLVTQGTLYSGSYWRITNTGAITIGTTSITWTRSLANSLDTVSFLQAGTGATTRTAQEKMRESVSVKDFGALGDGVTSDVTAFTNAVATGKDVFVPAGTYLLSTGFTLNDDQTIFGQGYLSVLRYTGSLRLITVGTRSGVMNLKLQGDGKGAGKPFQTGVFCFAKVGWQILNCYITAFSGSPGANGGGGIDVTALAAGDTDGGRVNGCYIYNNNAGLNCEDRGEYVVTSNCLIASNTVGLSLIAGNCSFAACNFHANDTNVKARTGANDGHSMFTSCSINHGVTFNIDALNIGNGMTFSGSNIYNGNIKLDGCTRFKFVGCDLAASSAFTFTLANTCVDTLLSGCYFPIAPASAFGYILALGTNLLYQVNTTGVGTGGAVVQATNKATSVTLNTRCGQITMNNANLNAAAIVSFTLTNSVIGADYNVVVHRKSGGTAASYDCWVDSVAAGSCVINVQNVSAGALAEAVVLQFNVLPGVIA